MFLYEDIFNRKVKISVVGLGYVGMPIAVAFAKKVNVIGFDINKNKVDLYKRGIDPTKEIGDKEIKETTVAFTSDETKLKEAKFHIIAVPTPINNDLSPDLSSLKSASAVVGRNLAEGSIVVFESTVYPGVTEEICVPILERESGLMSGCDFRVGYSPERINPGDKTHRLDNIVKIVAGYDQETLDTIAKVYELVALSGVYRAESIKVAEAAKVIENSQRDINIAFMNELSIIFHKMGIDTKSVIEAARTKWNFLDFEPGLVGGHCIGVDPYYLTYKAEQIGYLSQVILSGRRINDGMGKYVTDNLIKALITNDISVKRSKIAVLGLTFKENCPDIRNTKVMDIIYELREYGIHLQVYDPLADKKEVMKEYGIELVDIDEILDVDAVIITVAHSEIRAISENRVSRFYKNDSAKVLFDIKGLYDRESYERLGYYYWRL